MAGSLVQYKGSIYEAAVRLDLARHGRLRSALPESKDFSADKERSLLPPGGYYIAGDHKSSI